MANTYGAAAGAERDSKAGKPGGRMRAAAGAGRDSLRNMKEVWVLNQKALVKFIDKEPEALSAQEKEVAAEKSGEYIRGGGQRRA